ncbi:hypothetical protein KQI58_22120 [Enterococcus raffinosus]|uniref:hypothetical protein n=1 Tax=Enterococcus raffinosus TaxID=71452 RepID=UPI001C0FFF7E|nr:hypothetical protein [Enterococcus raffinosus]MBU5363718.1 hypothetical protein [Enterococcus raffinosus]
MDKNLDSFSLSNIDNERAFLQWARQIKSISSSNLHETILDYDKIIKERERRERFSYIDDLPFSMQYTEKRNVNFDDSIDVSKTILDIDVSPRHRKKVYVFVNQLIRGVEKFGGHVSTGYGQKMKFEVSLAPICWNIKIFEKSQRNSDTVDSKRKMLPKHHRTLNGVIELDITNEQTKRKTVFTSEQSTLSSQLVDIFSLFRKEYIPVRDKRIAESKAREAKEELRRQKEEIERLAQQALQLEQAIEQKRNHLIEEVITHQKEFEEIRQVERYLEELVKVSETDAKSSKVVEAYVAKVKSIYNIDNFFEKIDLWIKDMENNIDI